MKNFFFIFFIFGVVKCFAQQDTILSYSGIEKVDGVSKEELFVRARDWFSNNLQSIQIQDQSLGELSGKGTAEGIVKFRVLGSHYANAIFIYNLNIWLKDGRYMYRLTNINNTSITYNNTTATNRDDISSPAGILYTSDHSKGRVLGLSKGKSDETYQSAKTAFDQIAKELIASLMLELTRKSIPDF